MREWNGHDNKADKKRELCATAVARARQAYRLNGSATVLDDSNSDCTGIGYHARGKKISSRIRIQYRT